jgi:hypothetical protein
MPCTAQKQPSDRDLQAFLVHCDQAMAPIPDMEYYSCVGLCAFDAVFSIQTRYDLVVSPLIDQFCALMDIPRRANDPHTLPTEGQIRISELVPKLEEYAPESLADAIGNHQRTSSRSGILKTDAFLQYLQAFQEFGVETYQDVNRLSEENAAFETALRQIPGQNVSVDYFFMLAGDTDGVKVDTHLRRFVRDAVGRDLEADEIKELFRRAVLHYRQHGYPDMTARHLDHIVWSWQKSR